MIGNVEGGHVWFGHEALIRPPLHPAVFLTFSNTAGINEVDYHATTVGNVLAGSGYQVGSDPASYTLVGLGMAPFAEVWSGAIATNSSGLSCPMPENTACASPSMVWFTI